MYQMHQTADNLMTTQKEMDRHEKVMTSSWHNEVMSK